MIPHARPTMGDIEAAAAAVIHSGQLAQGRQVEAFEAEVAERLGRRHAVAVSSGTAALMLTLRALDVKGGRVLVPSYVCSALLHAAHHAGATAVLADVDRGWMEICTPCRLPLRAEYRLLWSHTCSDNLRQLTGRAGVVPLWLKISPWRWAVMV